jgi:glycerol-3-phosphate acyltransferase PlsY
MFYLLSCVIISYLLGSIPTAYIFARAVMGIDIRVHGSGNVGATNVARVMGKRAGMAVFALDLLKGMLSVTVIPAFLAGTFSVSQPPDLVYILSGMAAIVGHIWTVFLKFKGGKGVSTTAGVIAGIHPFIMLGCLAVWVIIFAIWKYVSLASIAAAIALPVLAVIVVKDTAFVVFCGVICLLGVYAHRSNIKRLIQGKETKIVKSKKSQ